jgi:hypothetical protein
MCLAVNIQEISMQVKKRLFYESSSGDRWMLARYADSKRVSVLHYANAPAGGNVTDIEIDVFLGPRRRHLAEAQALVQLIGTLAEGAADA